MKTRLPMIVFLVTLAFAAFYLPALCQSSSLGDLDKKVSDFLKKINAADGNYDETAPDTNAELLACLKDACKNPALLTGQLPLSQKERLSSLIAPDKQAHLFSWDSCTGGSMHFFRSLVQYRAGNSVYCLVMHPSDSKSEPPECGKDFGDLQMVKTKAGKPVYLATYSAYFSHPEYCRSIAAYTITNRKFVPMPIFKTRSGLIDTIDCRVSGNPEWNEASFVKISENGNKISVPIISKDGAVTGRFLVYKFDGYQFVFDPKAK